MDNVQYLVMKEGIVESTMHYLKYHRDALCGQMTCQNLNNATCRLNVKKEEVEWLSCSSSYTCDEKYNIDM